MKKINMKKNKKRLFLLVVMAISFVGMLHTFSDSSKNWDTSLFLSDVEALTAGESGGGDILYCFCALMSDNSCAVNNNGSSKCASGVNVQCWKYNNNCN